MSKMIQIRNVPDELHRTLKIRAIEAGKSLSEFLLTEIRKSAERPTPQQLRDRIESRSAVSPTSPAAEVVREERESR